MRALWRKKQKRKKEKRKMNENFSLSYLVAAYGFLVPNETEISFADWSERIHEHYKNHTPNRKNIVSFLLRFDGRISRDATCHFSAKINF